MSPEEIVIAVGVILVLVVLPLVHIYLDRNDLIKQAKKRAEEPYQAPTIYKRGV